MNKLNKRNVFERGLEILAWLEAYAPDIPIDRETTMVKEFAKLQNVVKLAIDYVKTDEAKRDLKFCLEDLEKAQLFYELKDRVQALKHMDSARRLFEEARRDKKSTPTFIVGPDGQTEKL